ncbi:MAG: hypothetical protein ACODAU_07675 [Myxococcota bacterium]
MTRRVTVAHHGHCFDGMASAAFFTRFLRAREGAALDFAYEALDHQPGGSHVPRKVLRGDVNAVLDFRYTTAPELTWFFDHHVTGVVGDEERRHLSADTSGRKFFDPTYGSCCKLLADVARERFGFEAPELAELVQWADVIDTARFERPDQPVRCEEPALALMAVVDVHGGSKFLAPRIRRLAEGVPLAEVAADPEVQRLLVPIREQVERATELIRQRASVEGDVVLFDLGHRPSERFNKFLPYALFPEARYTVGVTASPGRAKVSVGFNPWGPRPRAHDVAALCARYGGGGHPQVGAVSVPPDRIDRAREIARAIADALRA